MKRNILYVFDDQSDPQRVLNSNDISQKRVFLVPLTINEKKISQVEDVLRSIGNEAFIRTPFITHFNKKAFEMRDDFVKFIADFSRRDIDGKSLKEYFKYPFKSFSIWWFSLIAEKNTLKSNSFHSLVKLLTINELCKKNKCREVWLNIADNKLANSIKDNIDSLKIPCIDLSRCKKIFEFVGIFNAIVFALKYFLVSLNRSILAKYRMFALGSRKRFLKNCKFLLVTHFPYLDEQKLKRGMFVNKYYERLQQALEKKHKGSYAWLAMTFGNSKYNWRGNLALGRRINECGDQFMFCEEWAGLFDWLKVLLLYIFFSIKYFLRLSWISRNFRYHEYNLNIWRLFREDWHNSFCGYALIEGILYYRIFKNVFNCLADGTKVIYFAEMLSWEKALNIASSEKGKIKTIGIQHSVVPIMFLMYFNDRAELENGDYIKTMPKPDHLACVGDIPYRLFRDSGWKEDRIFSWGALRFQHFEHQLKHMVPWEKRKNRVIIALSVTPEISGEILIYTYQAFKTTTRFEFLIKSHPNLPINKLLRSLSIEFDKTTFAISDLPLQALLRDAKAVIVAGSSAALEAIANGCPIIIPLSVNFVDMNPISGLSNIPIYVKSPSEMRNIVENILRKKEPYFSTEQCRDLILNYCSFSNSDDDLLRQLEEHTAK